MSLGEEGGECAAVAVVQDHIRLDEILALIGAARAGSVALDALRHPYLSAAVGGFGIHHMAVEGRSIEGGAAAASPSSSAPAGRSWTVCRGEVVEQDRPFLGGHL